MCIFTREVDKVSATNIFVRGAGERQFLVYSMAYAAGSELAMVLPLPVPRGSGEAAVRFISLEHYPSFFRELDDGFPRPPQEHFNLGGMSTAGVLRVHDVGRFVASYVPCEADFARLDPRFRLPSAVWEKLPMHRDGGFAVFQLRTTDSAEVDVHPMALDFPRRHRDQLYFPTVHLHDGEVHELAWFDHRLYLQPDVGREPNLDGWEATDKTAAQFMKIGEARGILDPAQPCWRHVLRGPYENRDVTVDATSRPPERRGGEELYRKMREEQVAREHRVLLTRVQRERARRLLEKERAEQLAAKAIRDAAVQPRSALVILINVVTLANLGVAMAGGLAAAWSGGQALVLLAPVAVAAFVSGCIYVATFRHSVWAAQAAATSMGIACAMSVILGLVSLAATQHPQPVAAADQAMLVAFGTCGEVLLIVMGAVANSYWFERLRAWQEALRQLPSPPAEPRTPAFRFRLIELVFVLVFAAGVLGVARAMVQAGWLQDLAVDPRNRAR